MTLSPYIDRLIYVDASSDFSSGTFQLEVVANLIDLNFCERMKSND